MHTINYELLHDHAVIRFSGELTWESVTELAERIDTLTMRYFYKRIELVIHSPRTILLSWVGARDDGERGHLEGFGRVPGLGGTAS